MFIVQDEVYNAMQSGQEAEFKKTGGVEGI